MVTNIDIQQIYYIVMIIYTLCKIIHNVINKSK